jgi:hypothetical protein
LPPAHVILPEQRGSAGRFASVRAAHRPDLSPFSFGTSVAIDLLGASATTTSATNTKWRSIMSLGTILLIILILALIGALPTWPYSSGWGYYPTGGLGLVLLIIIILLVLGRI